MDPEPLIGMLADYAFEDSVDTDGVLLRVARDGDFRIEAEDELLLGLGPECEAGNDGGSGMGCEAREAGSGASGDAEEIDEYPGVE